MNKWEKIIDWLLESHSFELDYQKKKYLDIIKEMVGTHKPTTGDDFYNQENATFYYNEGYNKKRQELINLLTDKSI